MIYINNIVFTDTIEFEVTRQDQLKRKIRTESYEFRGKKHKDQYFELIPNGMKVDFSDITIIVGDNGIGKSTLLKTFKLPDFTYVKSEKDAAELIKGYIKNKTRTLGIKKMPQGVMLLTDLHKCSVRKDIGEKINADAYSGKGDIKQVADFLLSADDSNGEALIDVYKSLDYKNTVIILDEPETSLSLRSIGKLKQQLIDLSKVNQIIISTHHPYIMEICESVFDMETKQHINTKDYLKNYK